MADLLTSIFQGPAKALFAQLFRYDAPNDAYVYVGPEVMSSEEMRMRLDRAVHDKRAGNSNGDGDG